jgi:hypothetical protein
MRRSRPLALLVMLLVTFAAAGVAYLPYTLTPDVRPASAPDGVFSAERAMTQLEAVASTPRPMGSPEHDDAVAMIQARLNELGVESQVVEGIATRNDFNQVFAGRLSNVIARIPGTDSTGTVALLSHFDSLPTSMNANDGGLGVAALLETVRAIQAGPTLANDLVLWFGDADETTALNALLLQQHPWFGDVRFGFAFEAPGVTGPSVLTFAGQGSPDVDPPLLSLGEEEALSLGGSGLVSDNGRWLREALEAIPDVTVALPLNDLSLGASADLGMSMWGTDMAGVSFSKIGDSSGYHTILDRPDRVDPASLQQTGDISLALTRHFGDLDLTDVPDSGGLVAFTVAPGQTVTYPAWLALPAAGLVLLAAFGVIAIGKRRGRVTITGVLLGIGTTLVAVAAAAAAAFLVTGYLAPDVHYARNPSAVGWRTLVLSAVTLTIVAGLFLGLAGLLRRERRVGGLLLGPVVVAAALAVLTGLFMPALSYVFLLPALGGVLVAGWQVLSSERPANPWPNAGVLAVGGVMVATVGVPLVYLLASAVSVAAPMFAAIIAVFVALLGSLWSRTCVPCRVDGTGPPPPFSRSSQWRDWSVSSSAAGSVPSSHGPTTSSTRSTPTPDRPPGSPPGPAPTSGPSSSSPTATAPTARRSHPATTSARSSTSSKRQRRQSPSQRPNSPSSATSRPTACGPWSSGSPRSAAHPPPTSTWTSRATWSQRPSADRPSRSSKAASNARYRSRHTTWARTASRSRSRCAAPIPSPACSPTSATACPTSRARP